MPWPTPHVEYLRAGKQRGREASVAVRCIALVARLKPTAEAYKCTATTAAWIVDMCDAHTQPVATCAAHKRSTMPGSRAMVHKAGTGHGAATVRAIPAPTAWGAQLQGLAAVITS